MPHVSSVFVNQCSFIILSYYLVLKLYRLYIIW